MSETFSTAVKRIEETKYKAIFLGGEYDLTKMMLTTDPRYYYLCSKPDQDMLPKNFDVEPYTMEAEILKYQLIGNTPEGILIYEFVKDNRYENP